MKDGEHIEYYPSGEVYSKRNYLNGHLNGKYIRFLENGEITSKCNYLDHELHGEHININEIPSKSYYINGYSVNQTEWLLYNRNYILEEIGL